MNKLKNKQIKNKQINNIQHTFFDTRCLDVCAQSATCNHYSSLTGYVLRD